MIFGRKDPLQQNFGQRGSSDRNSQDSVNVGIDITSDYDCCMVFKADDSDPDGLSTFAKRYARKLVYNNCDTFMYSSNGHIFVLIRADLVHLRKCAESIKLKLLLDSEFLQNYSKQGDPENSIAPITILHDQEQTKIWPFDMIYMQYSSDILPSFYWTRNDMKHPFRSSIRVRLLMTMISAKPPDGSHPIKIGLHLKKKNIAAFYPLHNTYRLNKLRALWLPVSVFPWQQPFFDIKEYFGEKIGFYFRFLGHYSQWLLFPALAGIPVQMYMHLTNDYNTFPQVCCSPIMVVWAILMLQFWKRREKYISLQWGMIGFEDEESDRPEYRGKKQLSALTGKEEFYFPEAKRRRLMAQSGALVLLLLFALLAMVASIYVLHSTLYDDLGLLTQFVISLINSVQITIFNSICLRVAYLLTVGENHRTETRFENALVSKYVLFQFVNSYASFFYIAFLGSRLFHGRDDDDNDEDEDSRYRGNCGGRQSCMAMLAINLAVVFGFRMLLYCVKQYVRGLFRVQRAQSKWKEGILNPEKEFYLASHDSTRKSMKEYTETAIQFGYVALFITALPIAGLGALAGIFLRIKLEAWENLTVHQRPIPRGAENIGLWGDILGVIAHAAVLTNAGLITFTMDVFDNHSTGYKLWFFILFQWTCYAFQALARIVVSSDPEEVRIQISRADHFAKKILLRSPDEDSSDNFVDKGDFPRLFSEDGTLNSGYSGDKSSYRYMVHTYSAKTGLFTSSAAISEVRGKQTEKLQNISRSSFAPPSRRNTSTDERRTSDFEICF